MTSKLFTVVSTSFAIAAGALCLSVAAGPALAGTARVNVSAGDFATSDSRHDLDQRIVRAARKACLSNEEMMRPRTTPSQKQCIADAVSHARTDVAEIQFDGAQLASN